MNGVVLENYERRPEAPYITYKNFEFPAIHFCDVSSRNETICYYLSP